MATASLLPPNATALERALEGAAARIGEVPVPIGDLWSPARCPEAALPWLAWALAVEEWGHDWPLEIKRSIVANAVEVHRRKGTPAAVKRLLDGIGAEYDYTEPGAVRFAIAIHNSHALALDNAASLGAAIDRVKRVSAHYTLTLTAGLTGGIYFAGGLAASGFAEIALPPEEAAG